MKSTILKKIISVLVSALLMLSAVSPCLAQDEEIDESAAPELSAKAAVLMDVETHELVYSRDEDLSLYCGPISSLMSALLAVEAVERGELSMDSKISSQLSDYYNVDNDNTTGILIGDELTLEQLLYLAMLSSPGEACNMIARLVSGDVASFVELMNARASELGCSGTVFANANGADISGQFSCARDMALIACEAMEHELLMDICSTVSTEIGATALSQSQLLETNNYILRPNRTRYYYSGAIGMKAGYSDLSGYSLITSVRIKDKYAVVVLLGCYLEAAENGYYDIQSFVQARKLMQWFLDNYAIYDVIDPIIPLKEISVDKGVGADSVLLRSREGLRVFLPANADADGMFDFEYDIFGVTDEQPELTAPIFEGQKLGELYVYGGGNRYGPFTVIANNPVELSHLDLIADRISILLHKSWVKYILIGLVVLFIAYAVIILRVNAVKARKRRKAIEERRASVIQMPNDDFR